MAPTRPNPSSSSPPAALPDKVDAALKALLAFRPTLPIALSRQVDQERIKGLAAEEFIQLGTDFVAAVEDTPGALAPLEVKVTEVLDALKAGTPLRNGLDALDALLGQKLQQIQDEQDARVPGTVVFDQIAWDIPIESRVLIKFCQANDIDVRNGGQWIAPQQQQAIRSQLGKVLPHGKRPERVPIEDFARTLGISVQDIRNMLHRADMEEQHVGFLRPIEQNTIACLQKMPPTSVKAFELARALNMTNKELLDLCRRVGLDIKNQLSDVSLAYRNVIGAVLNKAGNDPAKIPDWSMVRMERRALETDRASVAKLKDWLDNPVLPFAGEQIYNFARQPFPAFTAEEASAVVHPLCEQAWQLLQLAHRNHFLGSRILLECRGRPRPYQQQQQLVDWCVKDIEKVVGAVQEAARAVCISPSTSLPTSPGTDHPFVFRLSGNVFQIRFGQSADLVPVRATKTLKQIRLLLLHPCTTIPGLQLGHLNAPPPRDRKPEEAEDDEVVDEHDQVVPEADRSERSKKKKVADDEGIRVIRDRIRKIDKKLKEEGEISDEERTEREKCYAYLSKTLFKPDAYLNRNAKPHFKDVRLDEEYRAQETVARNLRNAYRALEKTTPSLKPLVRHLHDSIDRNSKGFCYWPAEPAPTWQLD